nr:translation initiation factor IF-2-like [Anser cygnoides]
MLFQPNSHSGAPTSILPPDKGRSWVSWDWQLRARAAACVGDAPPAAPLGSRLSPPPAGAAVSLGGQAGSLSLPVPAAALSLMMSSARLSPQLTPPLQLVRLHSRSSASAKGCARRSAQPHGHSSGPGVFSHSHRRSLRSRRASGSLEGTRPGRVALGAGCRALLLRPSLPRGRQAARPRRAHRAARLPPGLRPGGQQVTGKRDPAWTEMKGGLAAADTRRHLPRRAGGPAAGMSLSPRAAPRRCRASSSLPAGEPPAPHAPAQSPRGLLPERGQGPAVRPSRPPAPCQQIPRTLTHPRVLTPHSGLTCVPCHRPSPVPKTTSPGNLLVFPSLLSLPGRAHPSLVLPACPAARSSA